MTTMTTILILNIIVATYNLAVIFAHRSTIKSISRILKILDEQDKRWHLREPIDKDGQPGP